MQSGDDNLRATKEDRLDPGPTARGGLSSKPVLLAVVLVAVAIVGGLLFLLYPGDEQLSRLEVPASQSEAVSPQSLPEQAVPGTLPAAADIPEAEPEPATDTVNSEAMEPALPAPGQSDPLVREQLESFGLQGDLEKLAQGENLLQRAVALIDGTSRGVILRKILPLDAPQQAFAVRKEAGETLVDEAGYQRFEPYVEALEKLDIPAIVASFHAFRALYEQAYAELGLPADELDNALIRSLDRILATPEIEGPIALEQNSVMYSYKDQTLEELPALQKQLLRTGPDNTRRIKAVASQLREQLLRG